MPYLHTTAQVHIEGILETLMLDGIPMGFLAALGHLWRGFCLGWRWIKGPVAGGWTWMVCSDPASSMNAISLGIWLTKNKNNDLVGGLEHLLCFMIHGIILPIDELIFFKMVKTTNQWCFGQSPTETVSHRTICAVPAVQYLHKIETDGRSQDRPAFVTYRRFSYYTWGSSLWGPSPPHVMYLYISKDISLWLPTQDQVTSVPTRFHPVPIGVQEYVAENIRKHSIFPEDLWRSMKIYLE
jgi:hypothetical protein